jgi:hypothetical protein
VNSGEAKEKPFDSRQTSDDVICRAQGEVGVVGVRRDRLQFLGVPIGISDHLQAVDLTLIDQNGVVRRHAHA